MDRIELINKSLRCFVLGLLGLLPILGLPMAVAALVIFYSVTRRQGREWNPAQRYLLLGWELAGPGVLISLLSLALILLAIVSG